MTQQQLADIVGCEASTIYRLESGRRELTGAKILAISDALGVHPGELFRPLPPHPELPDMTPEQLQALASLIKPNTPRPTQRRRA
jgi:transcriptional regulator with XRE-family HTH domain